VRPGSVLLTRPGDVRQWELSSPLGGVALFFEREFVHGFFADTSFLDFLDARGDARSRIDLESERFASSLGTLRTMEDELRHRRGDSDHALRAALYQLLVVLNRQVACDGPHAVRRPSLTDAFRAHVERHFREMQRVTDYAALLGVTPEHLTRSVRRATGVAASDVIHQRLVLEAKRSLLYTDLTVRAIADDLRFDDPSYFNRFFKRSVGVTPRAFRAARRS
jgi:AraC family transcriptional activator of pobA